MTAIRVRIAAMAGAILIVLGAVGCSQQPGVVAYVGDAQVTQSELREAVDAFQQIRPAGQPPVAKAALVNGLIYGELASQIARDNKITITNADRHQLLNPDILAQRDLLPIVYNFIDPQIVATTMGTEKFKAEVSKREVRVNPRFGTWDPEGQSLMDGSSASLSEIGVVEQP